jgi:Uri superfamily endonuclease
MLEKAEGQTYILLIYLIRSQHLLIGKLGWVSFKKGYYLYVGSAKKCLKKRLIRHLSGQKNRFWHIDYLLSPPSSAQVANIWVSRKSCECSIAQELYQSEIYTLVKRGFGSSDCQCFSHLFRVEIPDLDMLNQILTKKNFSAIQMPEVSPGMIMKIPAK